MLGDKVVCATISLHLTVYCHTYMCSVTGHSGSYTRTSGSSGVCHVMNVVIGQSNPDMEAEQSPISALLMTSMA